MLIKILLRETFICILKFLIANAKFIGYTTIDTAFVLDDKISRKDLNIFSVFLVTSNAGFRDFEIYQILAKTPSLTSITRSFPKRISTNLKANSIAVPGERLVIML